MDRKVFWDLQCPYSKTSWEKLAAIKERFGSEYDISIHISSLLFHPQAFTAQCGFSLIEGNKGRDAALKYVDTCFENQETFMNAALGDPKQSEVVAIFAGLAEKSGAFDDTFTKDVFCSDIGDWGKAVWPAYSEHKIAIGYGVTGTPKHVIDDKLVPDTESAWGADEWAEKLKSL